MTYSKSANLKSKLGSDAGKRGRGVSARVCWQGIGPINIQKILGEILKTHRTLS